MIDNIYLGQVVEIQERSVNERVVLLKPLYILDENKQEWIYIEEVINHFPNKGQVYWKSIPDRPEYKTLIYKNKTLENLTVGSILRFSCIESPIYIKDDPRKHKYIVNWDKWPEELIEIIKTPKKSPNDVVTLLENYIPPFAHNRQAYIELENDAWAGPIKFVQQEQRWTIDSQQREKLINKVNALSNEYIDVLAINGVPRKFLKQNAPKPNIIDELDWAPISLVIKRILRKARDIAKIHEQFKLTNAIIDQYVDSSTRDKSPLMNYRIQRAKDYFSTEDKIRLDIMRFEEELLAHPQVKKHIESAKEMGRKEAREQTKHEILEQAEQTLVRVREEIERLEQTRRDIEKETQRQLEERQTKIKKLENQIFELQLQSQDIKQEIEKETQSELEKRQAKIKELEDQILDLQIQLEEQLNQANSEMSQRIAELVAKPSEVLTQIGIIRAALSHAPIMAHNAVTTATNVSPAINQLHIPDSLQRTGGREITEPLELVKKVRDFASVDNRAVLALHSILLTGQVPLLTGPNALEVAEQYAAVVAAGRMLWVNVPPSLLEPADLLGRVETQSGRFIPHSCGLLDLLLFAKQPDQKDRLFFVVMDGINRSAVDSYLIPLLALYQAEHTSNTQRALRLAHPQMFGLDSPYAKAAELSWPSNVLMIGIVSEGPATLPLSISLWNYAQFIYAKENQGTPDKHDSSDLYSAVHFAQWQAWSVEEGKGWEKGKKFLQEITEFEGLMVPHKLALQFQRLFSQYYSLHQSESKACLFAVKSLLLPYALATEQADKLQEALQNIDITINSDEINSIQQVIT